MLGRSFYINKTDDTGAVWGESTVLSGGQCCASAARNGKCYTEDAGPSGRAV